MSKVEKIKLDHREAIQLGEVVKIITEKHAELFPDTDLNAQLIKLGEEGKELMEIDPTDTAQCKEELADIFIVACGIGRFCETLSRIIIIGIVDPLMEEDEEDEDNNYMVQLIAAIIDKMNRNIDRVWDKKNGVYKHISHLN